MSSKKRTKKDELISTTIEKEKKRNNNLLVLVLLIIVLVLAVCLIYIQFFKKNDDGCPICSAVTIKEVEVESKHQLINYQGLRFNMPIDWDFVSNDNRYEISNKDSNFLIFLDYLDIDFSSFSSSEYQRKFLEIFQTSSNVKIESSGLKTKDGIDYYYFEGTYDSYNYIAIAIGNDSKVILVNAEFVDKISLDNFSSLIIDFALSSVK